MQSTYNRASDVCMYVCVYVSHVLDRKLLERLMSPQQNRRLCSRPHSHESVIFSNFWDSYFSSYVNMGEIAAVRKRCR